MIKFIKENSYDIFKLFLSQIALAVFALIMTMWTANVNDTVFFYVGVFCVVFYLYLIYIIVRDYGAKDKPAYDGGRVEPNYLKGLYLGLCANALNIVCGIMIFVFSFFLVYQQPATVYNEAGEAQKLYFRVENDETLYPVDEVFSDTGEDVFTYKSLDNSREVVMKLQNQSGQSVTPCDGDGNELLLYSKSGGVVNTVRSGVESWASDLYGVPMVIATFTQAMYKAVHVTLFNNADWFYLVMPIPTLIACTLGYYLGLKGKRILFFLPELRDPRSKRRDR